MSALQISGIAFEAAGRPILQGVSLDVEAGETVALLGPSGSGKTTLLRMVAGLDRPSGGSVIFDGADLTSVAAHQRGFGMMFQDHALFPHLDVAGNVDFGMKRSGWSSGRRRERREAVLALVGLSGFEARSIEKLSGGERQRVALARALAPEPRMMMLDEPLGSLDRGLRERLAQDLRRILPGQGVPVLYVTHDQFEAFTVADRLAIMRQGRIVRTGSPREVWENPGSEFVARFLGMENIVARAEFGSVEGSGSPLVLLRDEGAVIEAGPGPGVVSGRLESTRFRGAVTELLVDVAGTAMTFSFPSSGTFPVNGEIVHIRVPEMRGLQPGDGTLL